MLEQHLDLGCKCEKPAVPEVVKGLDAKAIANAEELALVLIPDGVGKHAAIAGDGLISSLLVGMNAGLGVAVALVTVARSLELGTHGGMVEHLAVVGDP